MAIRQFIPNDESDSVFSAERMNEIVDLLNDIARVEGDQYIGINQPYDGSQLGIYLKVDNLLRKLKDQFPQLRQNQPASGSMASTSCICRYS